MHSSQTASTSGRRPLRSENAGSRSELERLRATCRRQAAVIHTLAEALSTFRLGAKALKDENAELRRENARFQSVLGRAQLLVRADREPPRARRPTGR